MAVCKTPTAAQWQDLANRLDAKGSGTITEVQANGTSITTTGVANIPAASTSAYGVTRLIDSTASTSVVRAATANAVKTAYDRAKMVQVSSWGAFHTL